MAGSGPREPHRIGKCRLPILTAILGIIAVLRTRVTAVTARRFRMGDTPIVNMVRKTRKNAFFEPGDTRQQWKGEAAASFVMYREYQ
jgi:hypothetical protein